MPHRINGLGRLCLAGLLLALLAASCDDDPTDQDRDVGTVMINCTPDDPAMPWILDPPGSNRFIYGFGDSTMVDMGTGLYVITWSGMSGWRAPQPVTASQTLERGSRIRFQGVYSPVD